MRAVSGRLSMGCAIAAGCLLVGACTRPLDDRASATTPRSPAPSSVAPSTVTESTATEPTATSSIAPLPTIPTTTTTTTTTLAPDPDAPATRVAFALLAAGNRAASITVLLDGGVFYADAAGVTNGGGPMTTDTPMVVASVSKLVTALTMARLVEQGDLTTQQTVPWAAMGFTPAPAWQTVTVRDLLAHTSGIPIARKAWLDDPGTCATPLATVLAGSPAPERGTWLYSNGNYCALGLLIEAVSGERYDAVARRLVLDPIGITGAHLTVDGAGPDDAPYAKGVARFDRLGAAGQWMISTDDVAAMLAGVTAADREVLTYPGVIVDQYGWGHTGSVDGAVSCAWVVFGGRAVVSATVSGPRPASGGGVCDGVVPAVVSDLGLPYLGEPVRIPD